MEMTERFKQCLDKAHYNVTRPRLALFAKLAASSEPLAIKQLVGELPHINYTTIYRNVALFEELEIVKRVWFGFKSKLELADAFRPHHHHVVCERCNAVKVLASPTIERTMRTVTRAAGYAPTRHHVEAFGLCGQCS